VAQETFSSLQQEVDVKSKQLKKAWDKVVAARKQKSGLFSTVSPFPCMLIRLDMRDDMDRERQELVQTLSDLQLQLKLKQTVLEHFIPDEELRKIRDRAVYDAGTREWALRPLETKEIIPRPLSAVTGGLVSVCRYSQLRAAVDRNPRYKCENTLEVRQ
jgi:kinesin family protein 3/17